MQPLVTFQHITKTYGGHTAVEDISFAINQGKCVGLIGVNGAGKTTTLRILSGLVKQNQGDIYYKGELINSDRTYLKFKKDIGYLSQYPKFYEWMTGYEFLSYVADLYDIKKNEKKNRIYEVLETVNLLGSEKKKIKGYSGGMKQRLGIAQAILNKPVFLILDEPVSALDPEGRYQIINLLQKIKKETTILLSTHILHDADAICDDVIFLDKGKKIVDTDLKSLKNTHAEPIIKVSFTKPVHELMPILNNYDWIENITLSTETELHIKVNDKQAALTQLPKIFSENQMLYHSFTVYEPSLEDIFLKLVSKQ